MHTGCEVISRGQLCLRGKVIIVMVIMMMVINMMVVNMMVIMMMRTMMIGAQIHMRLLRYMFSSHDICQRLDSMTAQILFKFYPDKVHTISLDVHPVDKYHVWSFEWTDRNRLEI